jgi:hypothetical protein
MTSRVTIVLAIELDPGRDEEDAFAMPGEDGYSRMMVRGKRVGAEKVL